MTLLQDPGGRLEPETDDINALGYNLAAVSYDSMRPLARFANRGRIRYPLLADPGSRIIAAFNLIDTSQPRNTRWYGSATPMIVVIDAEGVVRPRFSTLDHRRRPSIEAVLEAIRQRSGS